VNDVMVAVITPATNTIWGIEDPQTNEEWQVFIDAAAQVIDAANTIKAGGSGPQDSTWANDPDWQRFADVLIESGVEIQAAARARDLDTLMDVSNEKMYPPCEECHLQFHPGMQ
jgi:cytochrome c556